VSTNVIVVFGPTRRHEFRVPDTEVSAVAESEAQRWLDEQWDALGCEPARPSGKVLLLDKILAVATAGGEHRFADDGPWAHRFAGNVARLLERPVVLVDVADRRIG
jgi:hypothetical protein